MKKYNLFKILGIVILFTIIISYFVPGTDISYGEAMKGSINPVTLTDTFFNGLTSLSVFVTTVMIQPWTYNGNLLLHSSMLY